VGDALASSKRSGKSTGLFRAAFAIAGIRVRNTIDQGLLAFTRREPRIGRHGSEYHLVRGFSAPFL
jgi:hypothetical protein